MLRVENIAAQLESVSFRRAMKAITQAMRSGAKGIKVRCSGRLGGAEMSRIEWYREGRSRCTPFVPTSITASLRQSVLMESLA